MNAAIVTLIYVVHAHKKETLVWVLINIAPNCVFNVIDGAKIKVT